ncbi:rhodanese-like domain-containing protein [hot springs metagenome]|uniref:Rhodanese-like domain-containing protein n=1 Tax=hot springs metagenome TaxID=433727 RepID=A0A5J4L633_9ZZZZ
MKKYFVLTMVFVFVLTTAALAANYVKPDEFKKWMETGKRTIIVDIQPKNEFQAHHFKNSIETNAFPAKTDEEKKRLDSVIEKIKKSKDDVVIICPRGRSGASNTYDYIKSKGVPENRLYILEGGIAGWPYKEMLIKGK